MGSHFCAKVYSLATLTVSGCGPGMVLAPFAVHCQESETPGSFCIKESEKHTVDVEGFGNKSYLTWTDLTEVASS